MSGVRVKSSLFNPELEYLVHHLYPKPKFKESSNGNVWELHRVLKHSPGAVAGARHIWSLHRESTSRSRSRIHVFGYVKTMTSRYHLDPCNCAACHKQEFKLVWSLSPSLYTYTNQRWNISWCLKNNFRSFCVRSLVMFGLQSSSLLHDGWLLADAPAAVQRVKSQIFKSKKK